MSMSFGGGDPYAALVQALMQRQQAWSQRGQGMGQQQMPQMGGTMQMQPAQFGAMGGGGGQSGAASAMGALPSSSSMADMLKRMQQGWGGGGSDVSMKQQWATAPSGEKVPIVNEIKPVSGGY